jgi:hypothetical protein
MLGLTNDFFCFIMNVKVKKSFRSELATSFYLECQLFK